METVPEWLGNVLYVAIGGLGSLGLGLIHAVVRNKKIDTDDRGLFTGQLFDRLSAVEQQVNEERQFCERQLDAMRHDYEFRLSRRDDIISELRQRDSDRETRLKQLEQLIGGGNQ